VRVPAARCSVLWRGAVSGRGHGRFWLGQVAGRDVVVITHRFAFALEHGVDALEQVPLLGIAVTTRSARWSARAHVEPSTAWRNRHEWVMRRTTVGGALRDSRGARGRARAIRDAMRREPTLKSLDAAARLGLAADLDQLPLWE
jgi:negative regulator of sigma E activity